MMGGGSKLRRRCTTCLTCVAIVILIGIVATLWILLGQGAFKTSNRGKNGHVSNLQQQQQQPQHTVRENHRGKSKEFIEKTHLDHLGDLGNNDIEFVKPLKISPLPLHDHDIIFDQMRNIQDEPPLRHHSGHFRHRMAEIWDPHPRYVIEAFGKQLLLELEYSDQFVSPDLHITHVKDNFTIRTKHDPKLSGCYYTGKIKGDFNSDVAVSLCNGMTGYIRTSQDNYYIEPAEKPADFLATFLHRIKKIPHGTEPKNRNDVINNPDEESTSVVQCETNENHTIVEDDFIGEVVASMPSSEHTITKRELRRFDTRITRSSTASLLGSTNRESDWPVNYNEEGKTHEYFVKVLVVVDKSMMRYHQSEEDLRHYVLILMSHAALLYRHASIGNSLALSVVNIWMLDNTAFTNNNSQVMLRNFCEWQKWHAADRQHDLALLLTRDPICRKNAVCDTLGVAEVGSVCNPSASCAIVRERGLSSSYTIAHELGHALGMPHDEVKACETFHKGPKYDNIMAKVLNNETKPWIWSECSKHFVTEFLESSQAKCLTVPPSQNYISSKFSAFLPGENFEVDKQCELEFGTGYRRCPYDNQPHCRMLWCTYDEMSGCKSNLLPWADGTSCGLNYWCHHGECIPLNRQLLTPIDGGWGRWQPWSECSRTCGGGIKHSKRHCDSPIPQNGGAYCTGGSVQYISCNTQPCGTEELDFREYQCTQFNGITKNLPNLTREVQWVPKYGFKQREDLCKLYCRVKNSNSYYLLKEKVIDGTKCGLNTFDVCVNAVCRPGGCDNKLNSEMTLDECGICGGDNSGCREMTGNYNITTAGYSSVLRIPRGSSNIDIRQNANNDTNYLVLMDGETGEYILNSRTMIAPQQKDVIFGGVIISYSGSSAAVERITTPKNRKLAKDLILGVLTVGEAQPPDIHYRYIVSRENAPKFGWRLYGKQWTKCNSICTGSQYMTPVCVDLATNQEQPDSYCPEGEKEHQIQKRACNTHCQLRWNDVSRGACSVNCGKGVRNVYYNCVKIDANKEISGKYREIIDEKHCSILPKPAAFETCHAHCESTRWDYSAWSECSASCGGGKQRRSAKCLDHQNSLVDDFHCSKLEKVTEQICNGHKCPVWTSRQWSACSTSCGTGYRTRAHYCHVDGRIYDASNCDPRLRPSDKEECNVQKPCTRWSTGRWSECSAQCGDAEDGLQTRQVQCENLASPGGTIPAVYCAEQLKPNATKLCKADCTSNDQDILPYNDIQSNSVRFETRFKWITGAWTQCSQSCGGGISSRAVACRNGLGEENEYYCLQMQTPVQTIECNVHKCPEWQWGPWTVCDLATCEQRRQVTCRNATGNFVDDSECQITKRPGQTRRCDGCSVTTLATPTTQKYRWKVSAWKQCSTQCGRGQRHRSIQCEETTQKVLLVDQYCAHLRKPKATKRCEHYSCPFVWIEGPWSSCSASCGPGLKSRPVHCHRVHQRGVVEPTPLPTLPYHKLQRDNYCDMSSKPASSAQCSVGNCRDQFVWRTGPWKQCSHTCGRKGKQTRQVSCIYVPTGQKVQRHLCAKQLRPIKRWKCNQWKCLYGSCREIKNQLGTAVNRDYLLRVAGGKSAWIYCYKMDTDHPDEYISLSGDAANFAENYDKRLKDLHSCPFDGRRTASCDCLPVGPERSGFTRFWKVRVNITSLRIIGDDFTFSRQEQGMRVAYGTAGDCYSRVKGCAQGRFSIDLTGTSFKLADDVRWTNVGPQATSRINILDKRVVGMCGGYCGNCMPDSGIGLQVEIT